MATPTTSLRSEATQLDRTRSWWGSLITLCAILGVLMGLSFNTQNRIRRDNLPAANFPALAQEYQILRGKIADDKRTIEALQKDTTQLADSTASRSKATQALADDLNQTKFVAGLTPVQGPGLIVTLNDSKKPFPTNAMPAGMAPPNIIHDIDVSQIVNELKASGAEAVSVNDQRIVATSWIRCAGPTIYVNATPQTPPYTIRAIGDAEKLQAGLNIPGGAADQVRQIDPAMIRMTKVTRVIVPAYAGATQPKYARPVPAAEGDHAGKG